MNMRTEAAIPDYPSGGLASGQGSVALRIGGMTRTHYPPAIDEAIRAVKEEPGEFGNACPMGMFRSRLIVE
ncbi:hypothetical protein EJ069_26390 [Mesorhizobium sp. M2A.F.Ca.ET.043.05.1.1]|uniref:hypothetical protein n=1 Tax=Mesorhizobium sp. M2A.F.Ca.ET.043.05.1.1 TaxID=2493671 RepID=UPI000F75EF4E|nr:hypothetical protein [Mesorhizobium sp. M2A.F.Ca.ET.043.05.1.1]AZO17939.1 hypothetical protein EJ069_26390 [Mesorhizobium sp. M2A.F.Ca.ET.043.05.1.1]